MLDWSTGRCHLLSALHNVSKTGYGLLQKVERGIHLTTNGYSTQIMKHKAEADPVSLMGQMFKYAASLKACGCKWVNL